FDSGIHSAIYGKVRPSDVRRFRAGDKRDHCSDLINVPEAVERGGGLLRHRPLARGGIQLGVDRTRLHIVDRDAPAPELPGQRLSKYLYGSLRGRVGHKAGHKHTLTHGRTNHNDAAAALHMLGSSVESVCLCPALWPDRKSTRLNSSHDQISYAVFCLKKKKST